MLALEIKLVLAKMYRAETLFSLVCISGCFETWTSVCTYNLSGYLASTTSIALLDRAPCQAIGDELLRLFESSAVLKDLTDDEDRNTDKTDKLIITKCCKTNHLIKP